MPHSHDLALSWDGRSGIAACGGMTHKLPRRPRVMALQLEQILYAPVAGHFDIKEHGQDWRQMTEEERAYVVAMLRRVDAYGIQEIC